MRLTMCFMGKAMSCQTLMTTESNATRSLPLPVLTSRLSRNDLPTHDLVRERRRVFISSSGTEELGLA